MREALALHKGVELDDVGEDHYTAKGAAFPVKVARRLLGSYFQKELAREIHSRLQSFRPEVLLVYKGSRVSVDVIRDAKCQGVLTVNVFPDYSPHAYGSALRTAMGEYDLVISTKPFHPAGWRDIYGYSNKCVFVPHGYDPAVHYFSTPPIAQDLDVVLAASWRPEYQAFMAKVGRLLPNNISITIAGPGWEKSVAVLPKSWRLAGALYGRSYGEFLRRGRIALAPVNRHVVINGVPQPGDEDTTRTYELAAAHCFFLHQRTPLALRIYDQATEVPMWDGAEELVALITKFLPEADSRKSMAAAAHARAVPAYSIPSRASCVLREVNVALSARP